MTWSNEYIANSLLASASKNESCPACRPKCPSAPLLAQRLPPYSHIQSSAIQTAKQTRRTHVMTSELESALDDSIPAYPFPADSIPSTLKAAGKKDRTDEERRLVFAELKHPKRFEPFQVLRAIEKKNVMLLMEIRDQQFELLLQPIGGVTPLVFAQRLGKSHREMTILICGALSRRVNDLTDDPALAASSGPTKQLLSALRANLKIAVSSGLSDSAHDPNSTSLLASYLQILVMSDPSWLRQASHKVALAARGGKSGRPVAEAEGLVDKWVKRELKQAQIAAVEAYVGNAVGDLVLLGLWSVVTDSVQGEELESWFFARDDRMAKQVGPLSDRPNLALDERMTELKRGGLYNKLSPLVRAQLETSLQILLQRHITGRERVVQLKAKLDS